MAATGSSIAQPLQQRDANVPKPRKGGKAKAVTSSSSDKHVVTASELSSVHLDGEEEEQVEIYDTCDDVRKKINDHLKNTTRAAFSRELAEILPNDTVTSHQLARFLAFKGPRAGGHSLAYYAGYVFFEKMRIKQGKKKGVKRQKMEDAWEAKGGMPREGSHNKHIYLKKSQSFRFDQYGLIVIR
ncbi:hypothetical protein LTR27_011093 [Elasticomyces elasticus]|nr:hypothetical protein LTR27_011093 [Elasticomyces elasticus]